VTKELNRRAEAKMYLQHVAGLLPGRKVDVFEVHRIRPGDLSNWTDAELQLLIEEGRRQLERQDNDIERTRGRGQFLVTVGVAVLSLTIAGAKTIGSSGSLVAFVIWMLALLSSLLSVLGATSVVVARKEVGIVDSALLSQVKDSVVRKAARAYAGQISTGENTVATELTIFRDAVLLLVLGVALYGAAWLITMAY
jgi:hypothetical protein